MKGLQKTKDYLKGHWDLESLIWYVGDNPAMLPCHGEAANLLSIKGRNVLVAVNTVWVKLDSLYF